jgi:serine/threonine protein kinase
MYNKEGKMYNKEGKMYNKGGKVIASGGFGCVFDPALKCQGATSREKNKITKLMIERHALEEYEEINNIKQKIDSIPDYNDYFVLSDITICRPAKLTPTDLTHFPKKCSALPKNNITKNNINNSLDKIMALNIPNGGVPVDDYIYDNGSFTKIHNLHVSLVKLLKNGIIQMNKKNIYHCDIKDSNVLVDTTLSDIKTRLIDWGLSTEYIPFENQRFPSTWRNRPFQFNVPFSVVIFSDAFIEKYTKYLGDGGLSQEGELRPFVIDYINFWMKERGAGHYKYINELMFTLFGNDLTSVSESNKPKIIETQFTMNYIVDYIVNVLVYFTKFKPDGSLNLREYLDNVFIKIVDVWGFITIYYPVIELLSNNYSNLSKQEMKIFRQLQFIFVEYLYKPRHQPIDMNKLYSDLKTLGNLLNIKLTGKKKTPSIKVQSNEVPSIKTRKTFGIASGIHKNKFTKRNNKKTNISFKQKHKKKRFKNPYFLSFK